MKKFLLRLSCFLLIQVALLCFFVYYGARDSASNKYMYALKDKQDLLKNTAGRRLIFVGGSNLAFGLQSEELKKNLGYNPINMGLHGKLGLPVMLRIVKEQIREDDIVVVSPEFPLLFSRPKCAEGMAVELVSAWPGSRCYVQPDLEKSLDELVPTLDPMRKLALCVAMAFQRFKNEADDGDHIYRRDSFNEFGDHVGHYGLTSSKRLSDSFCNISDDIFAEVAVELGEFHQYCKTKNVDLYFLHPPVRETNGKNCAEQLDRMDSRLRDQIEFPILTEWREAVLADSFFFDSKFHLNQAGAEMRTMAICKKLLSIDRIASRKTQTPVLR